MKKMAFLFFLTYFHFCITFAMQIDPQAAHAIALRIWHNECAGKIEGLTCWNEGEDFASLGIGHFIWYPPKTKKLFQESFPALMRYIIDKGKRLPTWLSLALKIGCPWSSKENFAAHIQSEKMKELRTFLAQTIDLQIAYIFSRLENNLSQAYKHLLYTQQKHIRTQFERMLKSENGLYALSDYVNFKGEGGKGSKNYNYISWGLIDVLQKMNGTQPGKQALEEFVKNAKHLLEQRVANAPSNRDERRWIPGWFNRLNTYLSIQ